MSRVASLWLAILILHIQLPPLQVDPDWLSKFGADSRKRLVVVMDKARPCAGNHSIRFVRTDASAPYSGQSRWQDAEILIMVRDGMSVEIEENTIAHELYHIVLQGCEGFSNRLRIPNSPVGTTAERLEDLGSTITSCFDDAVIDRRLEELGFSPKALNHLTVEDLAHQPIQAMKDALASDRAYLEANGLAQYCWSLRLTSEADRSENLRIWKEINPEVLAVADEVKHRIGVSNCNDANSCFALKKKTTAGRDGLFSDQTL